MLFVKKNFKILLLLIATVLLFCSCSLLRTLNEAIKEKQTKSSGKPNYNISEGEPYFKLIIQGTSGVKYDAYYSSLSNGYNRDSARFHGRVPDEIKFRYQDAMYFLVSKNEPGTLKATLWSSEFGYVAADSSYCDMSFVKIISKMKDGDRMTGPGLKDASAEYFLKVETEPNIFIEGNIEKDWNKGLETAYSFAGKSPYTIAVPGCDKIYSYLNDLKGCKKLYLTLYDKEKRVVASSTGNANDKEVILEYVINKDE
jgi:hypothetical protein